MIRLNKWVLGATATMLITINSYGDVTQKHELVSPAAASIKVQITNTSGYPIKIGSFRPSSMQFPINDTFTTIVMPAKSSATVEYVGQDGTTKVCKFQIYNKGGDPSTADTLTITSTSKLAGYRCSGGAGYSDGWKESYIQFMLQDQH